MTFDLVTLIHVGRLIFSEKKSFFLDNLRQTESDAYEPIDRFAQVA